MPQGSSDKLPMAYGCITPTCSSLKIPNSVLHTSFPSIGFLAFHPAQYIFNKTRTAISRTFSKLSFSIDVLLRQICSRCCAICPSFVGSIAPAQHGRRTRQQDGHTFCNLHAVYLGMFFLNTQYKSSVRHQRLPTDNELCHHKSLSRSTAQKRSNDTKLCGGGIQSDRHARTAYCLSFVQPSCCLYLQDSAGRILITAGNIELSSKSAVLSAHFAMYSRHQITTTQLTTLLVVINSFAVTAKSRTYD